jgi:hypothetical protein
VITPELLVPTYKASSGNNMEDVLKDQDEYYSNTKDRRLYTYIWKMHMQQPSGRHIYIHEYKAKTYKNHAR